MKGTLVSLVFALFMLAVVVDALLQSAGSSLFEVLGL